MQPMTLWQVTLLLLLGIVLLALAWLLRRWQQ